MDVPGRFEFLVCRIGVACLALALVTPLSAQTGGANVSALSNIFRAGSNAPGLSGNDPVLVGLTAQGTGRVATFDASGLWNCCNGTGGFQGPDGGFTGNPATNLNSSNKIAGIAGPQNMWLVGVFLADVLPASAPTRRIYGAYNALTYNDILLGQVFFIGDGLSGTGSGTRQLFLVPDNATRLFLGLADGSSFQGDPGQYPDNVGSLDVRWSITDGQLPASDAVPEPATLTLLGTGLVGMALRRRRRALP